MYILGLFFGFIDGGRWNDGEKTSGNVSIFCKCHVSFKSKTSSTCNQHSSLYMLLIIEMQIKLYK